MSRYRNHELHLKHGRIVSKLGSQAWIQTGSPSTLRKYSVIVSKSALRAKQSKAKQYKVQNSTAMQCNADQRSAALNRYKTLHLTLPPRCSLSSWIMLEFLLRTYSLTSHALINRFERLRQSKKKRSTKSNEGFWTTWFWTERTSYSPVQWIVPHLQVVSREVTRGVTEIVVLIPENSLTTNTQNTKQNKNRVNKMFERA